MQAAVGFVWQCVFNGLVCEQVAHDLVEMAGDFLLPKLRRDFGFAGWLGYQNAQHPLF